MDVLFVEYPKCSTCKKAKKWLDDHCIEYVDRNIVEDVPTADELELWQRSSDYAPRRFFNTSGMKYRDMGIKAKLDVGMTSAEMFDLLASDGMLIKRPILVTDDAVLLGFKESDWEAALL
ncbi:MAG: arsenate reductase family protein [Eggerthellaceae bacterium]|nr:arsenate reductase family protein [Eggerthellaceae bacterium]